MHHRNLPEDLKLQTFFGQLLCIIIIPIPKSKELKQRSLKKFVLQLFGKFMLISQHPWDTADSVLLANWGLRPC